jgi:chaperone modulatory protein CbpM
MKPEQAEEVWLDAHHEFTFAELVQFSRLSEAELRELVDYGVLTPTDPHLAEWTFGGDIVVTLQAAGRLRDDLELDPQALALALTLIGRIRELEAELRSLRAQLPRRSA